MLERARPSVHSTVNNPIIVRLVLFCVQPTLKSLANVRKAPEASAGIGASAAQVEAELAELQALATDMLHSCNAVEEVNAGCGSFHSSLLDC